MQSMKIKIIIFFGILFFSLIFNFSSKLIQSKADYPTRSVSSFNNHCKSLFMDMGLIDDSILEIKNNSVLPEEYLNGDLVKLAENLVQRVHLDRETSNDKFYYNFLTDSQIAMQVGASFDSIDSHGFLNIHQTSESDSKSAIDRRLNVENIAIGLALEDAYSYEPTAKVHFLRPKYAYLQLTKHLEGMSYETFNSGKTYGSNVIFFKEEIKKRTTFTHTDSMWLSKKQLDEVNVFKTLFHNSEQPLSSSRYFEAMIWGPLTLRDVDYVLTSKYALDRPNGQSLLRVAKKYKFSLYQLNNDGNRFNKGAPLFVP